MHRRVSQVKTYKNPSMIHYTYYKIGDIKKRDVSVLMGDFNAKMGNCQNVEEIEILGLRGFGERNTRWEWRMEFAAENEVMITNTVFIHLERRLYAL